MNPRHITPPEQLEAARSALELLLGGWERAVAEADVSDRYRQVVADTVQHAREALRHSATPNNLVSHVLAAAFLLPYEPPPTTIMSADLEALGFDLDWGGDAPRLYPSVFDEPAQAAE